jgi:Ca-activated chloride channel family protein
MEFHFLRPLWLLVIPAAIVLVWIWHRRADVRERWKGIIAPHLLEALLVGNRSGFRLTPIHLVATGLILGAVATAGPTWEKEPPPFSDDKAPMIVALDLSKTMDAVDISPTRLERAKQKVRDLMELRAGSRTGLVVYAGSAHLVLPPAEDAALMALFLDALDTSLMPRRGRDAAGALAIANGLLDKEPVAGTVLFVTDGVDPDSEGAFVTHRDHSRHQVLMLSVGTSGGGPIRQRDGRIETDASGRPIRATFDKAAIERFTSAADIPLASVTLDDTDLQWVQRRAQRHMQAVQEKDADLHWKEFGYWLVFPVALLAALWFRKGSVVRWVAGVMLCASFGLPSPGHAAGVSLLDLFLTGDQQGRWHFDRGEYTAAAAHFKDPLWKGIALYRASDFGAAIEQFANLDTPEAYFLMGNCYARSKDYPRAVVAYDNALKARPDFPQALANRKLVAALIPKKPKGDADDEEVDMDPDQIKFDEKGKHGKMKQIDAAALKKQTAAMWMRNLKISPADFLRQKFEIEAAEQQRRP